MHEELIKEAIRFKLHAAEKILDLLPDEAAKTVRTFGSLVYESVGEHMKNAEKEQKQNVKSAGQLNKVDIE
jgi:hypothetical protein